MIDDGGRVKRQIEGPSAIAPNADRSAVLVGTAGSGGQTNESLALLTLQLVR